MKFRLERIRSSDKELAYLLYNSTGNTMKLTKFGILVNETTSLFTSIIRDSKISRGCEKILENPEGKGGHTANPFRGGYGYFLEPHIKYLRGREMVTADTLSHLSSLDEFEVPDMNVNIHHRIRIFPAKMQEFENETAKDKVLQQLSQQVVKGWPDSVNEVDLKVKPYWSLRDEILVENGLVLLGSCVIVPAESLRGKNLQQIHRGHFGIEKCKLRAKSCVH